LSADLTGLLERYTAAWAGIVTGPIASCWVPERFSFYKAEEVPRFFTAWDEVEAYWRANEALHEAVRLDFSGVRDLGFGLAVARMDWFIRFRASAQVGGAPFRHAGKAMAGWNHVLLRAEETGHGLRLTGWSETPDAAPLYLTELYYRAAD